VSHRQAQVGDFMIPCHPSSARKGVAWRRTRPLPVPQNHCLVHNVAACARAVASMTLSAIGSRRSADSRAALSANTLMDFYIRVGERQPPVCGGHGFLTDVIRLANRRAGTQRPASDVCSIAWLVSQSLHNRVLSLRNRSDDSLKDSVRYRLTGQPCQIGCKSGPEA
jgi:hypothetical protein